MVVATPGRLIDFIESGDTNLTRCTYLVSLEWLSHWDVRQLDYPLPGPLAPGVG